MAIIRNRYKIGQKELFYPHGFVVTSKGFYEKVLEKLILKVNPVIGKINHKALKAIEEKYFLGKNLAVVKNGNGSRKDVMLDFLIKEIIITDNHRAEVEVLVNFPLYGRQEDTEDFIKILLKSVNGKAKNLESNVLGIAWSLKVVMENEDFPIKVKLFGTNNVNHNNLDIYITVSEYEFFASNFSLLN